jgi:hypothetical protein
VEALAQVGRERAGGVPVGEQFGVDVDSAPHTLEPDEAAGRASAVRRDLVNRSSPWDWSDCAAVESAGEGAAAGAIDQAPLPQLADRLAVEVRRDWQPMVRRRARKQAATATGITVETRARFGFTAALGTTDDGRIRLITQHLPPVSGRTGGRCR